jgi:hypothetical protein
VHLFIFKKKKRETVRANLPVHFSFRVNHFVRFFCLPLSVLVGFGKCDSLFWAFWFKKTIFQVYLAAGVDPDRSRIFVQSHVRAHSELCWLLNTQTPMNWLERMIQ